MVSRGPNIIADYASKSCMSEDEENIQKFSENLVRHTKQSWYIEFQMQSFHQSDYSYHLLRITNNLYLLWTTTKSQDSPNKANTFLTALEEHIADILKMDRENLSLGISKILQKMIDNIEEVIDSNDKINTMEYELNDITESMKSNLTNILERGEKFSTLI